MVPAVSGPNAEELTQGRYSFNLLLIIEIQLNPSILNCQLNLVFFQEHVILQLMKTAKPRTISFLALDFLYIGPILCIISTN